MSTFSLRDWLFSFKTFAAAILALYIGFWLDLPRPYWAMTTVYICSQSLSGTTRSKAFFRVCGTVLGAVVTVALVPNLVNSPELLSLAISLWIAVCLYITMLDSTPRSYVFMLGGYTAALIGFPSVSDPGSIFDNALARLEEITLGILCASLVSGVIFPRAVGPLIADRLKSWLADADLWSRDVLAGSMASMTGEEDRALQKHRLRLAADAAELDTLSNHLAFDTSNLRYAARSIRLLRLRMLMLLPVLSALADRMRALAADGRALPTYVKSLLDDVETALRDGRDVRKDTEERLDRVIADHDFDLGISSDWRDITITSLLLRLKDLVDIRHDCRQLQRQIETAAPRPELSLAYRPSAGISYSRHRDYRLAALSALTAFLCVSGLCLFWIVTEWPDGGTAAMIAAVVCCLFASQGDPVPGLRSFTKFSAAAVLIAMFYLFAILPRAQDFEMLALALCPAFVFFGVFAGRPATALTSLALTLWTSTLMALQETYNADFAAVANSGLAIVGSIWFVMLVFKLMRWAGAESRMLRLLNASRTTLAEAAEHRGSRDRAHFFSVMLDRLGLLAPLLAGVKPDAELPATDLLRELRIGFNIIELREARHCLQPRALEPIDAMLDGLAEHFRTGRPVPDHGLLGLIDAALGAVTLSAASRHRRSALLGLVGIRYALFPAADPYAPQPPEATEERLEAA